VSPASSPPSAPLALNLSIPVGWKPNTSESLEALGCATRGRTSGAYAFLHLAEHADGFHVDNLALTRELEHRARRCGFRVAVVVHRAATGGATATELIDAAQRVLEPHSAMFGIAPRSPSEAWTIFDDLDNAGWPWLLLEAGGPLDLLLKLDVVVEPLVAAGKSPAALGFQAYGTGGWWGAAHWRILRDALARKNWRGPIVQTGGALVGLEHRPHPAVGSRFAGIWALENYRAAQAVNAIASVELDELIAEVVQGEIRVPRRKSFSLVEDLPAPHELPNQELLYFRRTDALAAILDGGLGEGFRLNPGKLLAKANALSVRLMLAGGLPLEQTLEALYPTSPTREAQAGAQAGAQAHAEAAADDDVGAEGPIDAAAEVAP